MRRRDFIQRMAAAGVAFPVAAANKQALRSAGGLNKQIAFARGIKDRESVGRWLTGPIQSFIPSFNEDGSIDFEGVRNFVDRSIEGGSRTILITAGDSHLICMTNQEIAELTKIICEHTAGRAMVVAADWETRTATTVEFSKYAKSVGASVLMTKPADWAKSCSPASFAQHCINVAQHLPVMIVTNSFSQRGHDFGIQAIQAAVKGSERVVAVKDDLLGDFAPRLCEIVRGTGVVAFAGGFKENHLLLHKHGCGSCYMSTFQAFAPSVKDRYWAAFQSNDLDRAREIIAEYEKPYFDLLMSLPSGWNAGMHGTLALYGITKKYRPKPYLTITEEELSQVADFLRKKHLL